MGGVNMGALKIICTVVYLLICAAIIVIVLMQDSKSEGLSSAITGGGSTNSYWSKNKGRSKEGMLSKITIILAICFIVLSVILNLNVMQ